MADSVFSIQCLPVCHLVLGDSWSNVWPTWTSESGWLGGVLQFVDFQRKIMGWFELLLLIELEYNNIVVSSILTLQHSLVSAGWSVSVYLANFLVTYALTNCYNIVLNQWFGHCSLSLFWMPIIWIFNFTVANKIFMYETFICD